MDWHIAVTKDFYDKNNEKKMVVINEVSEAMGWTGFTWNKKYYPDPKKFLNWKNT